MFHQETRSRWARVAAIPAVAALTIGLFVAFAPVASAAPTHPKRPGLHLTAAQKTCLANHGVKVPTAGSRSSSTPQQRQALVSALQACGVKRFGGRGRFGGGLTSAQRTCLAQHGVTLPGSGGAAAAGQRQNFAAALQACGIQRPFGPPTAT
jgi:hypothetical protein